MGRQLVPDEHAAIAEICHQQLTVGGSYRGWVIERLAAEPYVCLRETGLPQDELRGRAVLRGNFLKAQHANVSAVRHEERFFAQRRSTLGTAESPFGRLAPVVAFRTSEVLLSDYNLGGRKVRQRFRCVLRTCRTYGQHEKQTHRYAKPNPPHRRSSSAFARSYPAEYGAVPVTVQTGFDTFRVSFSRQRNDVGVQIPLSHCWNRTPVAARGARAIASAPFYVCRLLFGHQFDPSILRAAFGRVVGRHEVGLAVAVRMQPGRVDAVLDQVIDDRVCAPL